LKTSFFNAPNTIETRQIFVFNADNLARPSLVLLLWVLYGAYGAKPKGAGKMLLLQALSMFRLQTFSQASGRIWVSGE
jgi:hypothetical protein